MIGLGEARGEILLLLDDLAAISCASLAVGQFLQPSAGHWPVAKFYRPEEFEGLRQEALQRGFKNVVSGPLVRSSYHAAKHAKKPFRLPRLSRIRGEKKLFTLTPFQGMDGKTERLKTD